ncbi:adenylylsulfate kinase [Alkalidesulfovibrio alkalitolerans DSM 16529]|jgi:adenylylsulfate kinase|uniref:Adenylyl-sulfate kinase n=1 Tax=Alkalidesulfovibrio alkalitolerans DSM 16529 TaxID=1121439 RepID=S7UTF6_9BACT|nr:adenylyl-sulfate kinase [Alkalidesulfovibrio alkalitolerans]EPR35618.1 adenylylsulfate kinase [Alkalidesulfovibrio alkalitolerans DSM 16529]KKM08565.1 adenylylsulfate kinase [Clostridiales bacterium PH28_bin88]
MFTIWFTGLSGAGKTTLSRKLHDELVRRGLKSEWLDGDVVRANLSQGLTYSKQDRDINVLRIGFVSHLLNRNDVISVVGAIAPYEETRQKNRKLLGRYVEVFLQCSKEKLIERDCKGLYKKALCGEIKNFTGISDPYESPVAPEITIKTDCVSEAEALTAVIRYLEDNSFIPRRKEVAEKEVSLAE